jgi:hypothetical protein
MPIVSSLQELSENGGRDDLHNKDDEHQDGFEGFTFEADDFPCSHSKSIL